ncbi:ankyrin repeat and LEM domain-containing protein 2 [Cimex lectularius]|uniref:ANKLE2 third alpha/beta domain-containing protein n=1 Tax=Cimex lectularius TaxID=79782 RepID=A0A8I6TFS1_CIMLE|nr:ankyrin repeat and LEM domain-containing protein 2 [Cimex lectularius]XP_014247254.1 ankyrin repeat and LEM domain-containing protein 2 [Cimex lectularius]XP_014247255.1 ankyrin repeat and LEM domain-containing protein 2 [Cimex lectularius]
MLNESSEENIPTIPGNTTYYGIFIQAENGNVTHNASQKQVYKDKNEVMRILKSNKKARFKAFQTEDEAARFSLYGCELDADVSKINSSTLLNLPLSEKCALKAPKSQDLVKFRMAIERHDFPYVVQCITDNPRYLISSGDTPSILQEGTRYNALHVCARSNNAEVCKYILKTLGDVNFIERMYATKTGSSERCKILLDLYLNTPDKALNETPLHFASKLGALEVVKALVLHEQCDRHRFNKYHETPMDIICTRASGDALKNEAAIKIALEATYFVPVLRSLDGTVQPVVGEPFTPSSPPTVTLTKSDQDCIKTPPMQIRALAGPMSEAEASCFRKKFKTPPRDKATYLLSPSRTDPEKGLERVGRDLASKLKIPWTEYWEFLDAFVDLTSPEGLSLLENYLQKKVQYKQTESSSPEVPSNGQMKSLLDILNDDSCKISPLMQKNSLSPVSQLCADMENLHLVDFSPVDDTGDTGFDCNVCIINSYQVYARHIASAVKKQTQMNFVQAVYQLQSFIASCSCDVRFNKVNFAQSHYVIADIVNRIIGVNSHQELIFLKQISRDKPPIQNSNTPSVDCKGLYEAYMCIVLFLIDALEGTNEKEGQSSQKQTTCKCKIARISRSKKNKKNWSRKLEYSTFPIKQVRKNSPQERNSIFRYDNDDAEYFSDSSYSTPESSEEDGHSDDEQFYEADDGQKGYFLTGSEPIKLDLMVLDTIKDVNISQLEFPFIYFWKASCSKYSVQHPQTQWTTPKKSHLLKFEPRSCLNLSCNES